MEFIQRNALQFQLDMIKRNANLPDNEMDVASQGEATAIESIYEQLRNPDDEATTIRNLETLFNSHCSLEVVEKYVRKKTQQIENRFEDFDSVYDRAMNRSRNDSLTFQLIRSGIHQIYRVVVNVLLEGKDEFTIQLSSLNSLSHFGYNDRGIMVPLQVRGYLTINNMATLLTYSTMFFIFYEALLDIAESNSPNPQRLRSILYLIKSMVKVRVNDTTFYQTIRSYAKLKLSIFAHCRRDRKQLCCDSL